MLLLSDSAYDIPSNSKGSLTSPDDGHLIQGDTLIAHSIRQCASNPLASGIVEGFATNVVGVGLRVQSAIDWETIGITKEEAINKQVELEKIFKIKAKSKDIDIRGLNNLHQLADLAFRTQYIIGDAIVLLPYVKNELKIKVIEGLHLSNLLDGINPNIVGGVETNSLGKVIKYHLYKHHPLSNIYHQNSLDVKVIPAYSGIKRNVLHLYEAKRAGQLRGVPFISVILKTLDEIKNYTDAEIDAATLNARFAGFIYNDSIDETIMDDEEPETQTPIQIKKGNLIKLDQGWKVNFLDPARPNKGYNDFVTAKIKELCIAINYPFEMFMKIFNTSYTASRGAVIEGQKTFKVKRFNLATDFYQPIYEEIILREVLNGNLALHGFLTDKKIREAWLNTEWIGDAQEDMNGEKAAKAADLRVKYGFSTRDRESKLMNGTDYKRNIEISTTETIELEESNLPYIGKKFEKMKYSNILKKGNNGD